MYVTVWKKRCYFRLIVTLFINYLFSMMLLHPSPRQMLANTTCTKMTACTYNILYNAKHLSGLFIQNHILVDTSIFKHANNGEF